MTLYAVGDVQGCARTFTRLLKKISFDPDKDHLWMVGDLVNRGPDSCKVLRKIMALGDSVTCVLGNHDLHLLATAAGVRDIGPADTFSDVLAADDAPELLDWLRHRPVLHVDDDRHMVLVHAGIYPFWKIKHAKRYASEVEAKLSGRGWRKSLAEMYGATPNEWREGMNEEDQWRFTINAFTRMRYCDAKGRLNFTESGSPGSQPVGLMPWFEVPKRRSRKWRIVFGHWSALGLVTRPTITAVDTGCVWGRSLTAVPIDPDSKPIAVSCAEQAWGERNSREI
jgi:bis(5'-nucleosyl)-tetraphosphatase (symmetrical)